ncbi:hypothetical protein HNQ93_003998 [Hymenobacter luteus]|uniref:Uncharacterized protein n=2 Tax=Hymenobacter TaxID=89966 RepID=A0A7W9T402_9BACT|nr:hypothetical protein [Hymenobacter luteus]MBB6061120.1 hypothetical protein [Hymenobacter luteus]
MALAAWGRIFCESQSMMSWRELAGKPITLWMMTAAQNFAVEFFFFGFWHLLASATYGIYLLISRKGTPLARNIIVGSLNGFLWALLVLWLNNRLRSWRIEESYFLLCLYAVLGGLFALMHHKALALSKV